ncbi:hypothetical protein Hanom_Chr02g00172671 [Helianthus anomalus]
MDEVNEPDENGKDFKPFGPRCGKTNFWMKVAKLARPQGRKWQFTRKKKKKNNRKSFG